MNIQKEFGDYFIIAQCNGYSSSNININHTCSYGNHMYNIIFMLYYFLTFSLFVLYEVAKEEYQIGGGSPLT